MKSAHADEISVGPAVAINVLGQPAACLPLPKGFTFMLRLVLQTPGQNSKLTK